MSQSDWLAGEFRDCNGESNGISLPKDVIDGEADCDDLDALANNNMTDKIRIGGDNDIKIPSLVSCF